MGFDALVFTIVCQNAPPDDGGICDKRGGSFYEIARCPAFQRGELYILVAGKTALSY
jgi:hypothetical protein